MKERTSHLPGTRLPDPEPAASTPPARARDAGPPVDARCRALWQDLLAAIAHAGGTAADLRRLDGRDDPGALLVVRITPAILSRLLTDDLAADPLDRVARAHDVQMFLPGPGVRSFHEAASRGGRRAPTRC